MKTSYFTLTTITALALTNAAANELRGDVDVLLTIGEGCAVNGQSTGGVNQFGSVDFGEHSNLNLFIDAESTGATSSAIELTCNNALAYSVAIDDGQNANAGQRRMQRDGLDFVSYDLYQDSARSIRWGAGAEAQAFTGNGTAQPVTIYGRVLSGQTTPAAGDYTDTVRMTITW